MKLRKIFLLSIALFLLTGCTSIENTEISTLINDSLNSRAITTNTNRNGYEYYLPKGIKIKERGNYSEILTNQTYYYYLYVDLVSYYNKTNFTYHKNSNAYYSSEIVKNDKRGYVEINNYKNNQYLIEIMYNYAKIEVVVYERDIKETIAYAMTILSSVTYNDSVIKNNLDSNNLDSKTEVFDIFQIVGSDNYLEFQEDEAAQDVNKDPDYIK